MTKRLLLCCLAGALGGIPLMAEDTHGNSQCSGLPGYAQLKAALVSAANAEGSGLNMNMWGTLVDRDGVVCAVAFTGVNRGAQWPGSRVISAQKANTANAFSLDATAASGSNGQPLALSTANLFSAVQPGGSLFGLQESNPVDTSVAYKGPSSNYGTANDPMEGEKIGGVNVFGGGLALYDRNRRIIGAIGVSGDTSCADHMIAWRTRHNLNLDFLKGAIPGPASIFAGDANHPDNIIFDITGGTSASGFGHPSCLNQTVDPHTLPAVQ
jgi:uncharacterized protein GlcG (DUF336 family)